jgi:hypothetical protein
MLVGEIVSGRVYATDKKVQVSRSLASSSRRSAPYIGRLVRHIRIQDPHGIAGTELVLDIAAFVDFGRPILASRPDKAELTLEVVLAPGWVTPDFL